MGSPIEGVGAIGKAGVFRDQTQPLLAMYYKDKTRREAEKAKQAEQQWKQTNEVMDYADKFGLNLSKFNEFNNSLNAETDLRLRQGVREYLKQRPGDYDGARNYAARTNGDLMVKAKEYDGWKQTIDELTKTAQDGMAKGIYNENAIQKVRALTHNPDGSLRANKNENGILDDWEIRNSMANAEKILDDPSIYSPEGTLKNWVGGLDEQANQFVSKASGGPGRTQDEIEQTVKSGLKYMANPDGSLKIDEDGNFVPIINEFTLKMAMMDPNAKKVIEAYGGPTKESKIKFLQEKITPEMDKVNVDRQVVKGNAIDKADQLNFAFGVGFRTPVNDLQQRDERLDQIVTKNRRDLLSGLSDPNSDLAAYYTIDDKGTPAKEGQKPTGIALVHTGRKPEDNEPINTEDVASILNSMRKSGVEIKPEIYKIGNEENNRKTKIALSLRLDKLDQKRSIGEEYSNYVEAKYQHGLKNKPKTSLNASDWLKK